MHMTNDYISLPLGETQHIWCGLHSSLWGGSNIILCHIIFTFETEKKNHLHSIDAWDHFLDKVRQVG